MINVEDFPETIFAFVLKLNVVFADVHVLSRLKLNRALLVEVNSRIAWSYVLLFSSQELGILGKVVWVLC